MNWRISHLTLLILIGFLSGCGSDSSDGPAPIVLVEEEETTGALSFADVSELVGISYSLEVDTAEQNFHLDAGGVAVDDFNGDGFLDFFVAHGKNSPGKLFKGLADGTFLDITASSGVVSTKRARSGLFLDLDDDGFKDLLVAEYKTGISVYRNQGAAENFEEIENFLGISILGQAYSISAGDINLDGDLALAFSYWGPRPEESVFQGYLWEKEADLFVDITSTLPLEEVVFEPSEFLSSNREFVLSPSFSDVDLNGFPDLMHAADFKNTQYYLNLDGQNFNSSATSVFTDENGMGSAIGDYDNDGDLDWFISSVWGPEDLGDPSIGVTGNRMYRNNGEGVFSDVTDLADVREGYWGWGACFADFDNDGDLDLFHVNGYGDNDDPDYFLNNSNFTNDPSRFYINNGNGTFVESSADVGLLDTSQGRGISCLDYDKDGDIDILVAVNGRSPLLFQNQSTLNHHYLMVKLNGLIGNPDAIGAKVWITIEGQKQLREIRLGSNYLSNNPLVAHFGTGLKVKVDEVVVEWPDATRTTTSLSDIVVDQYLEISHPSL